MLKISLPAAQSMFLEIGYPTADSWDLAKTQNRVNEISSLLKADEDGPEFDSDEALATFDSIMEAQEKKEAIEVFDPDKMEVTGEEEPPEEEAEEDPAPVRGKKKSKASKKTAKKKAAKKPAKPPTKKKAAKKKGKKKAAPPPREKIALDTFGNREGTLAAKFNAVITDTPKTMKQLLKEIGHTERMYNHVNALIEKGLVVRTEPAYVLAEKVKAPKAPAKKKAKKKTKKKK